MLHGLSAVLAIVVLSTSIASAQTCRITAKSCSGARDQCVKLAKQFGMTGEQCPSIYQNCIATGVWAGPTCNIQGLRRS
jgi:hypothetical protein